MFLDKAQRVVVVAVVAAVGVVVVVGVAAFLLLDEENERRSPVWGGWIPSDKRSQEGMMVQTS